MSKDYPVAEEVVVGILPLYRIRITDLATIHQRRQATEMRGTGSGIEYHTRPELVVAVACSTR